MQRGKICVLVRTVMTDLSEDEAASQEVNAIAAGANRIGSGFLGCRREVALQPLLTVEFRGL